MKRAARKPVYRVGDIVEVVEPVVTRRVGYPMSLGMGYDLIAKELAAELRALSDGLHRLARKALGQPEPGIRGFAADLVFMDEGGQPVRDDPVIWALAKGYLPAVGYGGRERSLHTEIVESLRGQLVRVVGKRCVKTGTYYPPSGRMVSWECPEWESEPGGLDNAQTHVLLEVVRVSRDGMITALGEFTVEIEARCVRHEQAAPVGS